MVNRLFMTACIFVDLSEETDQFILLILLDPRSADLAVLLLQFLKRLRDLEIYLGQTAHH